MRKITKFLMVLLSYAPIATVAVAAQAKASEMDGEDQNTVFAKEVNAARSRVLPAGYTSINMEDAKTVYSQRTGLEGVDLEKGMERDLQLLKSTGLFWMDEKKIVASGPSYFASL